MNPQLVEKAKLSVSRKYKVALADLVTVDRNEYDRIEFQFKDTQDFFEVCFSSTGSGKIVCISKFFPCCSAEIHKKFVKEGLKFLGWS